ncbi:DUF3108 domain-containing protein [Faucicola mancuniensis]|uniref:DUF3108 domain-containing protein n=1 Tax=Faucicola mancuniensis TaxID=1309795 RepID=UPI0028F0D305|nr:DUF3108 domain-containing protein [uncultured Moraxella sp.]
MRLTDLFKVSILTMSVIAVPAVATVSPSSATYNFSIEGKYNGTATRTLKQNGNQWQYNINANVSKLATASQSATFSESNGNITPIKSATQYKILGVGRTSSLSFNNAKKQYVSTYKGTSKTVSMPKTAYDDLSLEMQIREDLKVGKFRGSYPMAERDKVDNVTFTKSATTKITVPAGTYDVVKIDRVHDDKSRQTSFWLAPSLDYLPVKMVQTNDGKKMEMNLTKVN